MYFSDRVSLLTEKRTQDKLKQWKTTLVEREVFCDFHSVSSFEATNAGQTGHRADARIILHIEDYKGETLVRNNTASPYLAAGDYVVYRKYIKTDTVELYLQEREGV